MIRRHNKLWIILLLCTLLTGCWDYEDIEKKSIVISVGVDRVKDNIEFSTEIAKLSPELGRKKVEAEITNIYTDLSYGKNFEEARVDINSKRPYPTFLGATRVVVFGTNYAKEGIEPYLNRINRIYDYRKTILAVVSRESPRELFKVKVENDISVGFLIEDNINYLAKQGTTLYPTVGKILSDVALKDVGYVLPYVGIKDNRITYLGLAVMKNSKLIGIFDIKDTDGILYILADKPELIEVIPSFKNDKNQFSFRVKEKKRKFNTNYIDGRVVINIDLDLIGQLQYQYYVTPVSDDDIKKLEHILSEKIKKDIITAVERTQTEFECDIFEFARYFRADYPKIYEQIKWTEEYPLADINVNAKVKIKNMNLADPNAKTKY